MRRIIGFVLGMSAVLVVLPVIADEDVDLLIAYLLHELEARQTRCGDDELTAQTGKRVVCGAYDDSFSAFRSDWDQVMRHSRLPIRIKTEQPWTLSDGRYVGTFSHGTDRELRVDFLPGDRGLLFAYVEAEEDPYAGTTLAKAGPLDLPGSEPPPRMAGFGGVSMPQVIAESRVEPYRSMRAQIERVVGNVTLEIVVNKDGSVRAVMALSAEPEGYGFAESAVEAVWQWRFEPAVFEGQPVDAVLNRTVEVKQDPPPPGDE